jgi:hypothetical protein
MTHVICNHANECHYTSCPHYEPHEDQGDLYNVYCSETCEWCKVIEKDVICIPEDELPIIEAEEDWSE